MKFALLPISLAENYFNDCFFMPPKYFVVKHACTQTYDE